CLLHTCMLGGRAFLASLMRPAPEGGWERERFVTERAHALGEGYDRFLVFKFEQATWEQAVRATRELLQRHLSRFERLSTTSLRVSRSADHVVERYAEFIVSFS